MKSRDLNVVKTQLRSFLFNEKIGDARLEGILDEVSDKIGELIKENQHSKDHKIIPFLRELQEFANGTHPVYKYVNPDIRDSTLRFVVADVHDDGLSLEISSRIASDLQEQSKESTSGRSFYFLQSKIYLLLIGRGVNTLALKLRNLEKCQLHHFSAKIQIDTDSLWQKVVMK